MTREDLIAWAHNYGWKITRPTHIKNPIFLEKDRHKLELNGITVKYFFVLESDRGTGKSKSIFMDERQYENLSVLEDSLLGFRLI